MNRLVGRTLAPLAVLALALAGCSPQTGAPAASPSSSQQAATVQIVDNKGTKTVATPPKSVVALDNRTFPDAGRVGRQACRRCARPDADHQQAQDR